MSLTLRSVATPCGATRVSGHRAAAVPQLAGTRATPVAPAPLRREVAVAAHHRPEVEVLSRGAEGEMLDWPDMAPLGDALGEYEVHPGAVPASTPQRTLYGDSDPTTDKPVLLYRDTNAWCPFCERVWMALEEKQVPYDTTLIDLRDKPDWYKEMVPTTLVPAARINGELVYESADILAKLEEAFPEAPLMPTDAEERAYAEELMPKVDAACAAGYTYLLGRARMDAGGDGEESTLPELLAGFEEKLDWLEAELARVEGPFLLGKQLSTPDIMMVPAFERLSANLPRFRGLSLDDDERFPGVARWLAAVRERPSFKRVATDSETHYLISRKLFGREPAARSLDGIEDAELAARIEAAGKIQANKDAIIKDIIAKSGLSRTKASRFGRTTLQINGYMYDLSPAAVEAIDYHLLRVTNALLSNNPGPPAESVEAACVGAAAVAFFRNRATSPRDMSADAVVALRAACDAVLRECF